jgi:hypothetical protein
MPDPVLLVEDKGVLREMFSGALASAGCRGLGRHRVAFVEESQVFTATGNEGASPDLGRTVQELRTPDSGSIPNQDYRQLRVYLA